MALPQPASQPERLRMLQGRGLRLPINAEGGETANQRWRGVRQPINAGGIQVLVILSTGAEFGIEVSDSPNSHKGVGTMRAKAVRAAWRSEGHVATEGTTLMERAPVLSPVLSPAPQIPRCSRTSSFQRTLIKFLILLSSRR